MESSVPKGNVSEGVYSDDEDDNFRRTSNMVVNETAAVHFVQVSILGTVELSKEKEFQDVKLDQEEDEQDHGEDQACVR